MAQFQALIQGTHGDVTRLGNKHTGMHAHVQSYEGQVNVRMWHDPKENRDYVRVTLAPHGHAADGGSTVVLYDGPCNAWAHTYERRLTLASWQHANRELAQTQPRE